MVEPPRKILIVTNDKVVSPIGLIKTIFSEPGTNIRQFENPDAVLKDSSIADCLDLLIYRLPTIDPEAEITKAKGFLERFHQKFRNSPFPDIIFISAKIGVAEEARNRAYWVMEEAPAALRNISGIVSIDEKQPAHICDLLADGALCDPDFVFPSLSYEFLRRAYDYRFPSFEGKFSILPSFAQREIARQIKLIEDGISEKKSENVRQNKRPLPPSSEGKTAVPPSP